MQNCSRTPTSVRLSGEAGTLLAEAARVTGRSQSSLIDEAVRVHLARLVTRSRRTTADRLAWLDQIAGVGERLGAARSAEEIDAAIDEIRGDR